MAMTRRQEEFEVSQGKSISELGWDALWFGIHTCAAVLVLFLVWAAMTLSHPDAASQSPKILATALAFLAPMVAGFFVARTGPREERNRVAPYIWISALLFFAAVCVWVIDLPTGPGLCETCGAVERLWRTFFDINHGSGLMGGDGLLVGCWVPLSMLGYAAGAAIGLEV